MAYHDDPPEYTGTSRKIAADPKPTKSAPPAPVAKPAPVAETHEARAALAELLGDAIPPAPVEPVKKPSHPKVAIVRPRNEWEAAKLETAAARVELIAAEKALRVAEHNEGEALNAWNALNRPDPDAVLRAYLARETQMRADNVAAGLPANQRGEAQAPSQWPIEQVARARGRGGPPLRSPVARRNI
jgi:hypothetical protein